MSISNNARQPVVEILKPRGARGKLERAFLIFKLTLPFSAGRSGERLPDVDFGRMV